MEGKKLIKSIRLRNILSYGERSEHVELQPLNVLIGRNASGKSNLIEAISLLNAMPKDLANPIREGGGIREWLWKGAKTDVGNADPYTRRMANGLAGDWLWEGAQSIGAALVETVVEYPEGVQPLRHRISFAAHGQRIQVTGESIGSETPEPYLFSESFFYQYGNGVPQLLRRETAAQPGGSTTGRTLQDFSIGDLDQEQSILSQLKEPVSYPEITHLGAKYAEIRLFREEYFGPYAVARGPQDAAAPDDFLEEDGTNLAMVLNDFEHRIQPKREVIEKLRRFYDEIEDYTTKVQGGTVQLFLHERGLSQPIPAVRLSDGTLRYLCLLTILCHPEPPPLLCIEEPELGLHPDIMPTIADLLKEASQRTQIIVTTHSDALVSSLSDAPESVLVCERDSAGTRLRRLEPEPLKEWLDKYSLGELWRMGEIGGNRW